MLKQRIFIHEINDLLAPNEAHKISQSEADMELIIKNSQKKNNI